jgi:DNA-binding transcriptional MerR regulator
MESKPRAGHYRVNDIARRVDRSHMTIIRWEDEGLIPKALRDSRGWRSYTKNQVDDIVKLIKKTGHFHAR